MSTIQTSCLQTLLCLFPALSSFAQSGVDTTQSIPTTRATVYYQAYIGKDAALYNGIAYQQNYRGVEGDPFFQTGNLKTGSVTYEDITYTHIPLLYDLVHDQVAIADRSGQLLIPATDKLTRFTFDDHTFVHLTVNNTPGYYELLSTGYATLLARHTKVIREKIEINELRRIVNAQDHYFLYKQGRYYAVESDKQLFTVLTDKKTELRQFQRSHHIRFKKDAEGGMKAVVEYYNQLSH